ncbi:aminotransferase class I/II-fold pyridoxal phosphate-dependent enzyme [Wenyingzhuangia sp. chi5]|uniref:Aminotransferase class I/II-fold pyridoxal phosphate-dependent enzyme n=1 Tax=Wenyingzhuangia gilva TaxID=3057677 RepID=A0ABT8VNM2_9FLAO|nr:aminotransferase class I/II-fold pyridoxal phosphate-dependent enzyme [Wenyingzhuangia sp. chi5]MDO3693568.1 aminotransferase class I/II-fold pyridoxal phosphate-dependent enzyme [Wenyingzhuangia sp. chi5]
MKKKIYLSPPDLRGNERGFLKSVFKSNWITSQGPMLNRFEEELAKYVNMPYALALNSATAAIHLGLKILKVKKGDKVLCPTFTFIASVNPISYIGAIPVLVDAERDTWNICPVMLEKAILSEIEKGDKPKALILVHGYGMPAKIDEILEVTKKYNILVLEDAAAALGATYKNQHCGTFGDVGVYSFNGNKIITTSGGGMLVTHKKKHRKKALYLATQAKDFDGEYKHSKIGYNYRMSNVLAAIGVAQFALLSIFIKKRRQGNEYYINSLKDFDVAFLNDNLHTQSNFWLTSLLFKNYEIKEKVRLALLADDIECRSLWRPMHQQKVYKKSIFYSNGNSDDLFARGLSLPSGSSMSTKDLQRVCNVIKSCF